MDGLDLTWIESDGQPAPTTWVLLLNAYALYFGIAFVVTLLVTPIVRRIAIATGVVDQPDRVRKLHAMPVAYLGGVAVLIGLLVAIGASYVMLDPVTGQYDAVPIAVLVGMLAIGVTGLADDIWKWDPRLKIAGQLVAAAALATQDIGVDLVKGAVLPVAGWLLGSDDLVVTLSGAIPVVGGLQIDLAYWASTGILALLVLGACNGANLIDGLDGLLTGTVSIVAVGLIAICMLLAVHPMGTAEAGMSFVGARLVLAFALLGAALGFLPHNFNPASIFLGDAGSLLLGYMCITIILMLGEHAQTHLVFAGLIIFALPIMDTALAIIRRRLAGQSVSAADDQHLHHQLRRSLGSVKKAVFTLYGIDLAFMVLGVALAYLVVLTDLRVRVVYVCALVLFGFIAVIAIKAARREQIRLSAERGARAARAAAPATSASTTGPTTGDPYATSGPPAPTPPAQAPAAPERA